MDSERKQRLIVGITGSSGAIYGIRLLEVLQQIDGIETHLVMSSAGMRTIGLETDYPIESVRSLADKQYHISDVAAAISSGSFRTMGMVVAPCSMGSLARIANSFADNLLIRAADVVLKERRRLVLVPRETPLHLGHVRNMQRVLQMGGIVMPPMPAFYHRPETLDDIINQSVNRILDLLGIELEKDLFQRWKGTAE